MVVTIKDVAKAGKVSFSTVSRALNDCPTIPVETRQRLKRVAKELGYVPNAAAKSLVTNRTNILGVVVTDIADPFIAKIVRYIEQAAHEAGYGLVLSDCRAEPEGEPRAVQRLHQLRVSAIIVPDPFAADTLFPILEGIGTPVVAVNRTNYPHSINTDNIEATKLAANHLLDLGHERIAFIGHAGNIAESRERQIGFEQALTARGIEVDPALIFENDDDWWPEVGRRCILRPLASPNPPTAVICYNDLTAMGVISAVTEAGFRVPDHLSVIGFDDIDLTPYLVPPLTTVAQQFDEIGHLVIEMILNLLDEIEPSGTTLLPGKLIVRSSTGPPAKRPETDRNSIQSTSLRRMLETIQHRQDNNR